MLVRRGLTLALLAAATAAAQAPGTTGLAAQRGVINQYCVGCHNEKLKTAGLMLDKLDLARVGEDAEAWEKVVRKLRAGLMPPAGLPRPDATKYELLTVSLENELDRVQPKLAAPGVHRMNRTQYANAVRDLLGLEIDPAAYLPADDSSFGFDNIASGLQISPAHVEGYVNAAPKISRLALGHDTTPARKVYHVREDYSQEGHIEGLPFGTRGGMLVKHNFPVDGEYTIAWDPIRTTVGSLFGGDSPDEQIELTLDGERLKLYKIGTDIPLTVNKDKNELRLQIKAGVRTVGIAFMANTYVPNDDLNRHYKRSVLDDNVIEGYTFTPQISMITISGPVSGQRAKDTPSRKKILTCQPAKGADDVPCAKQILTRIARQAYRRPLTDRDVERLLSFYQTGKNGGDFETGIERGLELILAHPEFVFRSENAPATAKAGEMYRISDVELASRLSFFLWSTIPDDELLNLAGQGKLHEPAVLDRQVRRMLADSRSSELAKNFAGQWWDLRMLQSATPEGTLYPDFDDNLRRAFRTESEMFFDSIMHEDRSALDLLNADYTFVNERLAVHYGIPNVYGSQFRRVTLGPDFDMRRGLLGKGSFQLATSLADRTSPVQRGKWVLSNILGSIPPDPPPNVPALKAPSGDKLVVEQTMRQRMEEHRSNPACAGCHRMMDPIGFALESFDAIGKWRTREYGQALDASGQLTDGSKINGVADLRQSLLKYSPQFVRTFTEKLMTYALGRGVEYNDMPAVRAIVRDSEKGNYKFSMLVSGIVKSQAFQMNRKTPGPVAVAQK